jgi:rhomboid protease GluP
MIDQERQTLRIPLAGGQPWASRVLLAINIIIYVVAVVLSLSVLNIPNTTFLNPNGLVLFLMGWKDNELILQGQYWRFLTAMFLHGGLMHIALNGLALHVLGPQVERVYGTPRFLAIYFLAGLWGGVASYAFSARPSVGASGAIFGLVGSLAVFFYTHRQMFGEMGRSNLQSMIAFIGINILFGLSASGIDNYAHMGGLAGGALSGWLLSPRYQVDRRFFPPVIERHTPGKNWIGIGGLALLLVVAIIFISPPIR